MPTKDELIAEAKKMAISLPSGKLSKAELEALISDHKAQAREAGGLDLKFKKDPMTGLSTLTRDRLNQILDNLNEKAQLPDKHPGKAKHMKTKGHVLLAIREKMNDLDGTKIKYGKLKEMQFQEIKDLPGYVDWLLKEITPTSHPHMIAMNQYVKLCYGLEKPEKKPEDSEDSSGPELMADHPEWVEPDWTEIPIKKETLKQEKKPVKTEVKTEMKSEKKKPPQPVWDGDPDTWEEYRLKCQAWILLAKDSASSSGAVNFKPVKTEQ